MASPTGLKSGANKKMNFNQNKTFELVSYNWGAYLKTICRIVLVLLQKKSSYFKGKAEITPENVYALIFTDVYFDLKTTVTVKSRGRYRLHSTVSMLF